MISFTRPLADLAVVLGGGAGAPPKASPRFRFSPTTGIATIDGTVNVGGTPMPTPTMSDLQGTSEALFTNKAGLRWELALGTLASPVTISGGALKVSRTLGITDDPPAGCANGIDNECGSAVVVEARATSGNKMMNVGLTANAFGDNTPGATGGSGDQIGVYGVARKTGGAGTVFGGYFEGRRDSVGTGIGIAIRATEMTTRNFTATDCTIDSVGGNCSSGWVTSAGTARAGAGIAIRSANVEALFQIGVQCTDFSVPFEVGSSCFQDDSAGEVSLRIKGSHRFGIDATSATLLGATLLIKNGSGVAWGTTATPVSLSGSDATGIFTFEQTGGAVEVVLKGTGTNPNKSLRSGSGGSGLFEIVNSAHSAAILQLSDAGALAIPGAYSSAGSAGITHTTTHPCAGNQVFVGGLLTAVTGTC